MIDEPNIPYPPRYRSLKRLAVAYTASVVLLVATWFAWDFVAQRRFSTEVARLRGLGQMVMADDFANQPPIADGNNAAALYIQAMTFTYTKDQDDFENTYNTDLRLTDGQRVVLRTFPVDYATNLDLVRRARQRTNADWKQVYKSPLINIMLPSLNNTRSLANLIGYTIHAHHLDGNDAEAVECSRDLVHLSAMMGVDGHTLVEHLVATGISALGCSRIGEIAMELGVDGSQPPLRQASTQPTTRPARPASRQQVAALIAELLDERNLRAGMEKAQQGEQAMTLDTIDWITKNPSSGITPISGRRSVSAWSAVLTTLARPMFRLSAVRTSEITSKRVLASREPTLPAMHKLLPDTERPYMGGTVVRQMSQAIERIMSGSMSRAFEWHVRVLASRRATAIKLALRLYQLDHDGQLPGKLEQLVPAYLPAVPADPFAADGRPMKFVRSMQIDGVETPVIYSVAENKTDDAASTQPAASRRVGSATVFDSPYDRDDLVFPLNQPPPADPPPPATQPSLDETLN